VPSGVTVSNFVCAQKMPSTLSTAFVFLTGYNSVVKIPKGATNIDIRQYAPNDNKDDDMYLGKQNAQDHAT
jgi:hypothetical protein